MLLYKRKQMYIHILELLASYVFVYITYYYYILQDVQFSKQFDNDKTNKAKMLKAMFSVSSSCISIYTLYIHMVV